MPGGAEKSACTVAVGFGSGRLITTVSVEFDSLSATFKVRV